MEETRAAVLPQRRTSLLRGIAEWIGYRLVLPRHAVLLALTWMLLIGQRLHLVPERLGLPRLTPRALRRLDVPAGGDPDAWLFTGCVMDAWMRDAHRSTVRVMRAAGARVACPDRGADCCGALHAHAGRVDEARALARRVIGALPGDAPVVVNSAGCGAQMKEYGRFLDTPDAHAFAARVEDFSEWLVRTGVPGSRAGARAVVVQDPCHLRHVQKVHTAVRSVLGAAFELCDTDDEGLCCGAGGAYAVLQPDLSMEIRARKVAALIRAGAGRPGAVVASANPGCIMHLRAAGLDVRHPADLLAEVLDVDR
jgi:glycolate oxidase iron-sulfur subunit